MPCASPRSCQATFRAVLKTAAHSSHSSSIPATACVGQRSLITTSASSTSAHCISRAQSKQRHSYLRPSHHRSYHSTTHPHPVGPFSTTERSILSASYAHVPTYGFTSDTLALGARDAGYLDISTNLLPDGVFSLIRWHLVTQREALATKAADLDGAMGVGAKVEALLWARLMGNREVIGRWQEALAIMAQPSYVSESLRELAKLSDEIWFSVGDTSVDPSWYTKRASLSAVYASAELFMTTDRSEAFVETHKFLRRRLEEVHNVGGSLRSVGQWVGFTASAGLNLLRSKGMRV